MKAVILAGGLGTRLSEETDSKPKPMVEIGGKPILWHIMKTYSYYGINDLVNYPWFAFWVRFICFPWMGDCNKWIPSYNYYSNSYFSSNNGIYVLKWKVKYFATPKKYL